MNFMNNYINLDKLNMNHFTELDAQLYCQIFNIDPDDIIDLSLFKNNLTDISGVSIFKNLKTLHLSSNLITDISSLKNLINLEYLYINNLNFTDEIQTVKILKSLPNLKTISCEKTFKTININKELKGFYIYE